MSKFVWIKEVVHQKQYYLNIQNQNSMILKISSNVYN
jgi:hypothetical protein